MSDQNKEDRFQAIYQDLPYTHPEKWGAIQMRSRWGASLRQCEQDINALVNKIYEDQSL